MSEKMTRIRLRHAKGVGFLDWGEHSFAEMVATIRRSAEREMEKAQAILDAEDGDFEVTIVRGPIVQHFVREVSPSDDGSQS